MKDLYNLELDECVALVKRNIVDCIYSSARLEGIAVTFPDTLQIYEGRSVSGLSIDDINKINNLKHAWQFVLDTLDYPLDLMYLRHLNQLINETLMPDAGEIRGYMVSIGGTSWKPDIPDPDIIREDLNSLMNIPCVTERAIRVMLYIMRTQMFSDGNKRVAQIAANQILIKEGKGYLKIPEDQISTFYELLVKYYETNNHEEVAEFIYNTSIQGKIIIKEQDNPPIDESMFYSTKQDTTVKHHPRR